MKQRRLRSLLGAALFPLALVSGVPQVHAQAGTFIIQSPAFADGGVMDRKYAGKNPANPNCTGDNVSPALAWSDVPAGTTSLALIVSDPQGAGGQGMGKKQRDNAPMGEKHYASILWNCSEGKAQAIGPGSIRA